MTKEAQENQGSKKELPIGWRWVRLGEVCNLSKGRTPREDWFSESGVRIIRFRDVTNSGVVWRTGFRSFVSPDYADELRKLFPQTILLTADAHDPASIGRKLCFVDQIPNHAEPAYYSGELLAIRCADDSAITSKWPLYWFSSQDGYMVIQKFVDGVHLNVGRAKDIPIPLPPLPEQQRITTVLDEQMSWVEKARVAAEIQIESVKALIGAYIRVSFNNDPHQEIPLSKGIVEVSKGIGSDWEKYPLFGATREGIAPAKERVGKNPERYKLVDEGTIFYNPMRILLGSIAMIDGGEKPGITSPDYVVFKTKPGVLHSRWFYYWLRSSEGDKFIKTLARGAVRERMLFRRLSESKVEVPSWNLQVEAAAKMKNVRLLNELILQKLDMIRKLPALFLRRAFNGEL